MRNITLCLIVPLAVACGTAQPAPDNLVMPCSEARDCEAFGAEFAGYRCAGELGADGGGDALHEGLVPGRREREHGRPGRHRPDDLCFHFSVSTFRKEVAGDLILRVERVLSNLLLTSRALSRDASDSEKWGIFLQERSPME